MKQLVKIYRSPTEDKTDIHETKHDRLYYQQASFDPVTYQHLYFTSDEDIKENNYVFNTLNNVVFQMHKHGLPSSNPANRKIVATTDSKLWKSPASNYTREEGIWGCDRIPQQFIEDYCKAGGIDGVYVKVEQECKCNEGTDNHRVTPIEGNNCIHCGKSLDYKLKLDSNNCVIICSIKESWNREEVIEFGKLILDTFHSEGRTNSGRDRLARIKYKEWIKENLK